MMWSWPNISWSFENRSAFMLRIMQSKKALLYPEDEGTVFCRYSMWYLMTQRRIIVGLKLKSPAKYNAFTFVVTYTKQRSALDKQDAAFLYISSITHWERILKWCLIFTLKSILLPWPRNEKRVLFQKLNFFQLFKALFGTQFKTKSVRHNL
jgi:hypothetical protein